MRGDAADRGALHPAARCLCPGTENLNAIPPQNLKINAPGRAALRRLLAGGILFFCPRCEFLGGAGPGSLDAGVDFLSPHRQDIQ